LVAFFNFEKLILKIYSQYNFFEHTFCEFQQVDDFEFSENTNYKSKSESQYFYTDEGIYRKSNHWGRVANCRWKLISTENYKNQQIVIAFAKWSDFYPINSKEKLFSILVNFDTKSVKIQTKIKDNRNQLYTYSDAQKRVKQIRSLFKNDKWIKHFDLEKEKLEFQVISEIINSNKTLAQIKRSFK